MDSTISKTLTVLARVMISAIFLMSAIGNKIPKFSSVAKYMEGEGVPSPQIMLVGAIVFLIVGSLSVIAGFHARFGAFLLLVFLAAATYYFHDFWNFQGQDAEMQMIQFLKNLGLAGAMLFIVANGSGPGSLDSLVRSRNSTPNESK